jgi:alpha-1,3-rhamnosyl/mannosyltransferase
MRFLLDARALLDRNADRGVGSYVRGLLDGIASLGRANDVELLVDAGVGVTPGAADGFRISPARVPAVRRRAQPILEPFLVSSALARSRPSLYHGLNFSTPVYSRVPVVVTVQDLIPFVLPSYYGTLRRDLRIAKWLLPRADVVIASSHSTARDLVRHTRVDPERIHVVPLGVAPRFGAAPSVDADATLARLGVRPPFLLAVGVFDPRKRIEDVVGVTAAVRKEHDVQLVIAGDQGWFTSAVAAAVERSGLTAHTRVLGFVDDGDLVALYQRTACLVFASAYEGFGLPPLEAMAAGAPVAMYDNSSLPEVGGDVALLAPDGDVGALAAKVTEVLGDPREHVALAARGRTRASEFTWERVARETLTTYEQVLRGSGSAR